MGKAEFTKKTTAKKSTQWEWGWLRERWFLIAAGLVLLYVIFLCAAMLIYVFLPDRPGGTQGYHPYYYYSPDGSKHPAAY